MYSAKSIWFGIFFLAIVAQLSLLTFYTTPIPVPSRPPSQVSNGQEMALAGNGKRQTEPIKSASDSSVSDETTVAGFAKNNGLIRGLEGGLSLSVGADALVGFDESNRDREKNASEAKILEGNLSPQEIEGLVRRVCVQIFDRDSGAQGTGVVVDVSDNGFEVLTACHVVKRATAISVFAFEQEAKNWVRREHRTVELVRCDEDSDLARIRIRTPIAHLSAISLDVLAESAEKNFLGTERLAWTVSWTEDGKPLVNQRKIAERRTAQRKAGARPVSYWILNGPSEPGMSGGPLLSTRGELIGIASGNSGGNAFYVDEFEISRFPDGLPSSKIDKKPK